MQREQTQFVVVPAIAGQLPTPTVEDEAIGRVPVLDYVQPFVYLPPEGFGT